MKPIVLRDAPRRAAPALVEPGSRLADILAELAARMTPEQRAAFLGKMATMDRHRALSADTVTLGRA